MQEQNNRQTLLLEAVSNALYSIKKSPQPVSKCYLHHSCIWVRVLINNNFGNWDLVSFTLTSIRFTTLFFDIKHPVQKWGIQQVNIQILLITNSNLLTTSTAVAEEARGVVEVDEDNNLPKIRHTFKR